MKKLKIYWSHPKIRDYRMPLFQMMAKDYNVKFLLNVENPEFDGYFNVSYLCGKSRFIVINFRDLFLLAKGIRSSDVFITSFLTSNISFWGILIAKALNKRIIVWEERWLLNAFSAKKKIKLYVAKIISQLVDSFYVMGDVQKTALTRMGVKSNKIFVANEYTGIDYSKINQKQVDYLSPNKKNILFIGRFVDFKGIEYIIDAFHIIENEYKSNDFVVNIIGFGPLENNLKEKVQRLRLQCVKFHPPVFDVEEKSYIYYNSHIAIISSIVDDNGNTEGGPIITLEYLSAGLPIIGTTAMGSVTSFLHKYKIGILINEKSAREIADALIQLDKLISSRAISKESVRNEFTKVPGFSFQYEVLNNALLNVIRF